jgi:protein tyrosine phosphatase
MNEMDEIIDYTTVTFPSLPSLEEIKYMAYQGPTPESNKVVDGIYAGAFPGHVNDAFNKIILTRILHSGVTKFVCLQQEYNPSTPKKIWYFTGLRPYFTDVEEIVKNKHEKFKTPIEEVSFEHLPIKDLQIGEDYLVISLAKKLVKEYYNGVKMYIHCWGGHGRTGVLICIMLHLMYGLDADDALKYCHAFHRKRECIPYCASPITGIHDLVTSPQTEIQFKQVRRIIDKLFVNKKLITQKQKQK